MTGTNDEDTLCPAAVFLLAAPGDETQISDPSDIYELWSGGDDAAAAGSNPGRGESSGADP